MKGKHSKALHSGCDLRPLLEFAREQGCMVENRRGTGEVVLRHPLCVKPLRMNSRKKSAPRAAVVFLRRLLDNQGGFGVLRYNIP